MYTHSQAVLILTPMVDFANPSVVDAAVRNTSLARKSYAVPVLGLNHVVGSLGIVGAILHVLLLIHAQSITESVRHTYLFD